MTTLTDRYAWAVVRLLPERQRPEIEREVRSLVADLVDARAGTSTGATTGPDEVEREVLTELGDPARLAARYVERPRSLIGQEYFPEYLRTLKLVMGIAVPIITALAVLGAVLADDDGLADVLGAALSAMFDVGVQVAFWVTLVYAFADRWKADDPWTPEKLPDAPEATGAPGLADTVFGIVTTVLVAVALVWQHVRPPLRDAGGDGVPPLHPDLWGGRAQLLLGFLALSVMIQVVVLARRRWTRRLAVANLVSNVGFLAVVAWAAVDERLVNTRFLEVLADRVDWSPVPSVDPWIPIVVVAVIAGWDSVEAFLAARRTGQRAAGVPWAGRPGDSSASPRPL